ncbi:UrcA family protein [Achromobacter spanius]|uniref:UrcA family protein n=1 Tax=Achromobacter spanius TaxID=217203 RepID=UPI000B22F207|nr:UrcA family protein [Achromobacter spanius]
MPLKLLRPDHARSRRASAFRLAALLLAALIALTLAAAALAVTGLLTRARPADVAIVLGNTVLPSGEPSPRLAARLDRALRMLCGPTMPHSFRQRRRRPCRRR